MPIWSGTLDTATKVVFVFNSDILSVSVLTAGTGPCQDLPVVIVSPITSQWATRSFVCSGHFNHFDHSLLKNSVTHNLSLVFKWLGDFWMPYSMIRSLSWMQSACTAPSQDEGPWRFDLRDDCWHCCCSSQGEEGACDQQHSYLSEVDQNTAQASAQALAQTGRIAWHAAWTRLTAVISSFIMSRAYKCESSYHIPTSQTTDSIL